VQPSSWCGPELAAHRTLPLQVTEVFPYGQQGSMGRRDMRPGRCSCSAEEAPDGAVVAARWEQPHAGHLREHYKVVAVSRGPDELHVSSVIHVGQRSETTLQVCAELRSSPM
jgi:hypothetical protein